MTLLYSIFVFFGIIIVLFILIAMFTGDFGSEDCDDLSTTSPEEYGRDVAMETPWLEDMMHSGFCSKCKHRTFCKSDPTYERSARCRHSNEYARFIMRRNNRRY